jgi:hypothetical protein
LLAATCLGALATALVRRSVPPGAPEPNDTEAGLPLPLWAALEALVLRVGGWIALGLLAQSYIESFVREPELLASLGTGARALLALVIALPASVCTAGAVPLAAALVGKGLSPVVAMAGLVLGPLLSNMLNVQLRAGASLARASLVTAPLGFVALGLALWLPAGLVPTARAALEPSAGVIEWAALAALGLMVARSIWRVGIRGWLGLSLRSLGPATRRHAHAH